MRASTWINILPVVLSMTPVRNSSFQTVRKPLLSTNPFSVDIVVLPAAASVLTIAVSRKCSMGSDSSAASLACPTPAVKPRTTNVTRVPLRNFIGVFIRIVRPRCIHPLSGLDGSRSLAIVQPTTAYQDLWRGYDGKWSKGTSQLSFQNTSLTVLIDPASLTA